MVLEMESDAKGRLSPGKTTMFLGTPAQEVLPMFSPDGKWIAYAAKSTGDLNELYVRPFPGPGGVWRVSTDGGSFPRWSASRNELLFTARNQIWSASYTTSGDSFIAEKPKLWAPSTFVSIPNCYAYDLHPDGERVVLFETPQEDRGGQTQVVFVTNFREYVKTLLPAK